MNHFLIVFLGGGIGAALRHGVNRLSLIWFGPGFPVGTLVVNVAGSLAMGLLIGAVATLEPVSNSMRLFLATGILGGFTTFSAFSLEAVIMVQRGQLALAGAYAVSSVAGSMMLLFIGLYATKATT